MADERDETAGSRVEATSAAAASDDGDAAGGNAQGTRFAGGPVEPERASAGSKEKPPKPTREEKARAREEYRSAKAEMKRARKRAGKSNVWKAIAAVLAVCVLVAAGGAAGWYFTDQRGSEQIDALQTQLSSTQSELSSTQSKLDEAKEQVEETTKILDSGSQAYLGQWHGELISTLGAASKRCYGASEQKISLDIESIDKSGQMQLSARLPYHGHETATLVNDVRRHEGDAVIDAGNITSTFSSRAFSFRVEGGDDENYAVATVSPTTSADAHIQLGVIVESYYKDSLVETDQYLLKKAGDDSQESEATLSSEGSSE